MKERHENIENEMKEHLNSKIFTKEDLEKHTLDHKKHKDLRHIQLDEGY
jgi:hypothetical protein